MARAAWCLGLCALLAVPSAAAAAHWTVVDPGQGPMQLASGSTGADELSGLTWAGETRYLAVSDGTPMLYPLIITLEAQSGAIDSASLAPGVPLKGSADLEGVAVERADDTVLVSDEIGPAIRRYRLSGGEPIGAVALPPVYAGIVKNRSLESLSLSPDARMLWTANEEALTGDGSGSTFHTGTTVRLQRFERVVGDGESGAEFRPAGQWAYRTDAIPGELPPPGRDIEASGVSDLVALPDDGLLVLERGFGAEGTRARLYEVDRSGATDTSAMPTLVTGAEVVPVHKWLLWERLYPDVNYEGIALGPTLADGRSRSLVVISDDGHGLRQTLYGLKLTPDGP